MLQRIAPTVLTSTQIDAGTRQTVYKAGYGTITVKSIFSGTEKLENLFYEILQNKFSNYGAACYNGEAIGLHDISAEAGGAE